MARPQPLPRWAQWFGFALVAALVGFAAFGTWRALRDEVRDARLNHADVLDRQVTLGFDSCNAEEIDVDVDESANQVSISVRVTNPADGDDCADGARVMLAEPLAERALVDGSTGRALRCQPVGADSHECSP